MKSIIPLLIAVATVVALSDANAEDFDSDMPVVVSAELERIDDTKGLLKVTAEIADGFHVYAQSQPKPFLAAVLSVDDSSGIRFGGRFIPDSKPSLRDHESLKLQLHEFERSVTWSAEVSLPVQSDEVVVNGTLFYQACTTDRCLAPNKLQFSAVLTGESAIATRVPTESPSANAIEPPVGDLETGVVDSSNETAVPAQQVPSESKTFELSSIQPDTSRTDSQSIAAVLPFAFLAGLILNFMPCVLPVVGLKVLSFVEQSGHNRRRMILLNVTYSAGLISVMMILASLAVFAGFGWGEQFSSVRFSVTLAAVVFAFGLSFLGVWEIPIPGLVSSAANAGQKEGLGGAYSKGVLSTVLATPCSGPFLGSALAWAVSQPTYLTYLVFFTVGLGMASPYLLIGLFPKLVSFLPKPGNWMVTFKQVMGFVLLGTVIYLLSFLPLPALVPTVVVLLGVSIGCWMLGGTLLIGTRSQKLRVLLQTAAVTVVAVVIGFGWLEGVMADRFELAARKLVESDAVAIAEESGNDRIPWQPFSKESLETHIRSGKDVFVDFTADWCLTCKSNEAVAVETEPVRKLLQERSIVSVRADKTQPAPEVDELLRKLGNSAASIPFYAVFPADRPDKPILLDGVFASPQPIIDALHKASDVDDRQARGPLVSKRL